MRIAGAEAARLERAVDPLHRKALAAKEILGLLEAVFVEQFEAQVARPRLVPLAQHQAVVAAFLHRAKVDRLAVLVGDLQAQRIDVEGARFRQIGDDQLHMAEPDDVERRIEVRGRDGHGSGPCRGCWRGAGRGPNFFEKFGVEFSENFTSQFPASRVVSVISAYCTGKTTLV